MYNTKIKEFLANFQIFLAKYFIYLSETIKKMDKTHAVTALQNAVAFLKGQKIIKKEIEISTETGFSKGSVSSYITGNQIPSKNFLAKFEEVYKLNLNDFSKEMPVEIGNPAAAELEAIIRTESLVRVNASYIAEIYGHLMKVAPTKVLKEMEQMADSETHEPYYAGHG